MTMNTLPTFEVNPATLNPSVMPSAEYVENGVTNLEAMLAVSAALGNVATSPIVEAPKDAGNKFGAKLTSSVENNNADALSEYATDLNALAAEKLADLDRKVSLIEREKKEAEAFDALAAAYHEDIMMSLLGNKKSEEDEN